MLAKHENISNLIRFIDVSKHQQVSREKERQGIMDINYYILMFYRRINCHNIFLLKQHIKIHLYIQITLYMIRANGAR